uniref:Cadherin domain-containing protein n=1 Tax=Angiostrongylus cantonensis TaxID=6313 RepID=A0A158PA71_ANGCA
MWMFLLGFGFNCQLKTSLGRLNEMNVAALASLLSPLFTIVDSRMWSRCFFPESELAPFFYDVDGDVRAGTVIVESVVNPPDAEILLASFNLTERFAIEAWPSGRFALIYVSPLTLFGVDSMQVFVTVVCNGEAFPLFSLIIRTKVITSPQFYNEPYHLEVNEKLSVGEILNTPLVVIDWDSEFIPPKMYIEDTNSPFEVVVEKHSQISAPVRKITANQTLSRRPTLVRLKLIKPIKHLPINLKLIAKKSMTAPVALQELVERNPESISQQLLKNWKTSSSEPDSGIATFEQFPMEALRNSVTKESPPRFEHCSITVEMPENSAIGSYVTTLSVLDRKKWTKIDILNPDGTFEIHQDSGNVYIRDNRFIDRELLANLELVAKIRGSSHRTKCSRTHVTVVLLDENDNRPTFEKDKYVFVLSDKFLANAVVGTVRAIDIDEGEGGRVSYRFVNDSSLFIIRRRGQYGEIVTNSSLDGVKDFVLILEACDNAPPF